MDAIDSGNDSEDKPMSTDMPEEICDGSKSHPSVTRREARYKICDYIKQRKTARKVALVSTQNMGKDLQKLFKAVIKEILRDLPILVESGS